METYPTPLEFLLANCYHNKDYETRCKEAFKFFIHEDVTFLYEQKMIIVGKLEQVLESASTLDDLIVIKEEDFFTWSDEMFEKPINSIEYYLRKKGKQWHIF